ncbi:MAG: hypothetical protein ABI175_26900 [Polyangiales bacterium]
MTPELDAISLKALARDVADRYQNAAQLAADLDSLIAGYRFDPKELRQFMRQLFRKEYAKEQEDTQLSLDVEPGGLSMSMTPGTHRLTTQPCVGTPTETVPRNTVQTSGPQPPPPEIITEPAGPADEGDKPRGFWGSLFKKRK